jgi:hypothetical protein
MLISHRTGIVLICFALGGAASETLAGGDLASPPPAPPALSIVQFGSSNEYGNVYTFDGTVTGGNGSPITINFGNLASLVGKTTNVGSDGTFTVTIELTYGDYGLASAQAVNTGGQQSNVAYTPVFP